MSTINTIEVWGEAVGLVAEIDGGFRYFCADHRTRSLDRRVFRTLGHARLAAIRATRVEAVTGAAHRDTLPSGAAMAAAARSLDRISA